MAIRKPGCIFCKREAFAISKLAENIKTKHLNINIIGIVHEVKGTDEFRSYLKGKIYFDKMVILQNKSYKFT